MKEIGYREVNARRFHAAQRRCATPQRGAAEQCGACAPAANTASWLRLKVSSNTSPYLAVASASGPGRAPRAVAPNTTATAGRSRAARRMSIRAPCCDRLTTSRPDAAAEQGELDRRRRCSAAAGAWESVPPRPPARATSTDRRSESRASWPRCQTGSIAKTLAGLQFEPLRPAHPATDVKAAQADAPFRIRRGSRR